MKYMPSFKTLPVHVVQRALEGSEDLLTPLVSARNAAIKSTPCPRCGTSLQSRLAPLQALYTPDDPLPKMLATCPTCGFQASADTGVVYSTGDGRKVDDPFPIIKPSDD